MGQMTEQFVAYLVDRLRAAGALEPGAVSTNVRETEAYIGLSDRWLVRLVIAGPRVVLSVPDPSSGQWKDYNIDSLVDLDSAFPEIVFAVEAACRLLTVYSLKKDQRYRIVRDFTDHFGHRFAAGEELVFVSLDFLPYEDGYTLHFVDRGMWLKGGTEECERFGHLVQAVP